MYALRSTDIGQAVRFIREGRVTAFPTGTSYGLACDALQGHALQRLRNLKNRPAEKTFTIFLDTNLWDEFLDVKNEEREILSRYANTALTLLVKPKKSLAHLAQDGVVGLRVIDHPMMQELAQTAGVPLTATSANISGDPACYDTACIETSFPGKVGTTYDLSLACILDGGNLQEGLVSTIAKLDNGKLEVVRQGALILK